MLVMIVLAALAGGCASTPRTTRIQYHDFQATTEEMKASLAASDFLAGRTPRSPPAAIVIRKVENLTTDIIPIGQQWMWMAKVADSLPIRAMEREKNIVMVVEPERFESIRKMGFAGLLEAPTITPTHALMATFYSAERAPAVIAGKPTKRRANYYYLQYQLTDIQTREVVWSDAFEFQREAKGTVID